MMFSKVVGVTFQNEDGESRQNVVKALKPNQPLMLVRDPKNVYDANAVMVLTMEGKQVGFLSKAEAVGVAPKLDKGAKAYAFVLEVTGGAKSRSYGCNIRFDVVEA